MRPSLYTKIGLFGLTYDIARARETFSKNKHVIQTAFEKTEVENGLVYCGSVGPLALFSTPGSILFVPVFFTHGEISNEIILNLRRETESGASFEKITVLLAANPSLIHMQDLGGGRVFFSNKNKTLEFPSFYVNFRVSLSLEMFSHSGLGGAVIKIAYNSNWRLEKGLQYFPRPTC